MYGWPWGRVRTPHWGTEAAKRKGVELFNEGYFFDAVSAFNWAAKHTPDDYLIYANRAAALTQLGHFQKAISDCEHALFLNPDYARAYIRWGRALIGLGHYEAAKIVAVKALSDPAISDLVDSVISDAERGRQGLPTAHPLPPKAAAATPAEVSTPTGSVTPSVSPAASADFPSSPSSSDGRSTLQQLRDSTAVHVGRGSMQAVRAFDAALEQYPWHAPWYVYRSVSYNEMVRKEMAGDESEASYWLMQAVQDATVALELGEVEDDVRFSALINRARARADLGDYEGAVFDGMKAAELEGITLDDRSIAKNDVSLWRQYAAECEAETSRLELDYIQQLIAKGKEEAANVAAQKKELGEEATAAGAVGGGGNGSGPSSPQLATEEPRRSSSGAHEKGEKEEEEEGGQQVESSYKVEFRKTIVVQTLPNSLEKQPPAATRPAEAQAAASPASQPPTTAAASPPQPKPQPSLSAYLEHDRRAKQLQAAGQLDAALQCWFDYLHRFPMDPNAHFKRAHLCSAVERPIEAMRHLQTVEDLSERQELPQLLRYKALMLRGRVLVQLDSFDDGIAALDAAAELAAAAPSLPDAYEKRAREEQMQYFAWKEKAAVLEESKRRKAAALAREASADGSGKRGQLIEMIGGDDDSRAGGKEDEGSSLDSSLKEITVELHCQLAEDAAETGDWAKAEEESEKALVMDASCMLARQLRARAYEKQGMLEQAVAEFEFLEGSGDKEAAAKVRKLQAEIHKRDRSYGADGSSDDGEIDKDAFFEIENLDFDKMTF